MAGGKRRFGAVRQLPSGRWQARYRGPDDIVRPAPHTFARKRDAEVWLTKKEAEILAGDWLDPDAGKISFDEFARSWIEERPNLRQNTVHLYTYLVEHHLAPTFGRSPVTDITEPGYGDGARVCWIPASVR